MLTALHVKNLALIEEEEVLFCKGLNILSGETGAGKSVLIGSLNLALGQKADRDIIRTGKEFALIELTFTVTDEKARKKLSENDITPENDEIMISRKIMPGKSVCRICGETVSAKQLKEISEVLLDIHGQHEHQSLLYPNKQLEVLDGFCPEELKNCKEELTSIYSEYHVIRNKLNESLMDENDRKRQMSLLQYEYSELTGCNLIPGEDDILEQEVKRMSNFKRITEALLSASRLCSAESDGCEESLMNAIAKMNSVEHYDEALVGMKENLLLAEEQVSFFLKEAERYLCDNMFEEQEYSEKEERLNILNSLKEKYRCDIPMLLQLAVQKQEEIERLEHYDDYLTELKETCNLLETKLALIADKISAIRMKEAKLLSKEVTTVLPDLNFTNADFSIEVVKEEHIGPNGANKIEFMIAPNPGEPLKPLRNIASGGELSRIMLALKTVVASRDGVDTLIFDEIDTGISGKTAWQVSKRLGSLAKKKQIICITHLPQIAAMADHHFLIEKKINQDCANTTICELDEVEATKELARLLGSGELTNNAILNATEMKDLAVKHKNEIN